MLHFEAVLPIEILEFSECENGCVSQGQVADGRKRIIRHPMVSNAMIPRIA